MFSYQIQLALISQYLNDNTTTLIKTNWNSITLESEGKKKKKKKEIYAKDRIFGPLDWFLYLQKPKHHRFITTKNVKFLSSPDMIHKSKCKLKLENRQNQRLKKKKKKKIKSNWEEDFMSKRYKNTKNAITVF